VFILVLVSYVIGCSRSSIVHKNKSLNKQ